MKKCIGCGITLQKDNKSSLGYTENLENNLCERCFKLTNYGQYQKVSLTNKDYQEILKQIPNNSKILYITDILSLELINIEQFKNITLVITKKDILPKSIKPSKIINYIKNNYPFINDIIIISSKTEEGIKELYNKIEKEKEVYIVGPTNVGKSTLINKLINLYGNNSKKNPITVSMYPSTTLNKIEIKLNKVTLIDTPGLINENNIINYLETSEIKKITPKKEIKPKSCQLEGMGSIVIEDLIRIDYNTNTKNSIVIYTSNLLKIRFSSPKKDNLHNYPAKKILIANKDIVIPGLGFIKCTKEINISLYIKKDINIYIRDNLI